MTNQNPFSVKTPETLTSENIAELFVDVYTDFPKLKESGHTFIHGARGTGKSMMLRYLEPSVQIAAKNVQKASDLSFFAIHVPIRTAILSLEELERLDGSPYWALAENLMILHLTSKIFSSILTVLKSEGEPEGTHIESLTLLSKTFLKLLIRAGSQTQNFAEQLSATDNEIEILTRIISHCDDLFSQSVNFLRKMAFHTDGLLPYEGALCDYLGFIVPLIKHIKSLSFVPQGPIFIMLDDADNLSIKMQKIVNTWVSCRTTNDVCLKITTQLKYKTYRTVNGQLIESPHDYNEVDIGTIYTGKNTGHYYSRVKSIVESRLHFYGIESTAEEYFPINPDQAKAIKKIETTIKDRWEKDGKGAKKSDDVLRYAVPEYMTSLKNTQTYSYAGFKSLVDISAGVIRAFLEPAARMYAELAAQEQDTDRKIIQLTHQIQDNVIKNWSEEEIFKISKVHATIHSEAEGLNTPQENDVVNTTSINTNDLKTTEMLFTLINSLGAIFRQKLLTSGISERKYISIMLSSTPTKQIQSVLDLGVEWGYLQKSTIGSKEGIGRNPLYILSKSLAPYFKLDPSGYCAYMSITSSHLELACFDSKEFLKNKIKDEEINKIQHNLFDAQGGSQ